MGRLKRYTNSPAKRISFKCKECGVEMMFKRSQKDFSLECKKCGMYFLFTGEVVSKYCTNVLWRKPDINKKISEV